MTEGHTPGPWRVHGKFIVAADGAATICQFGNYTDEPDANLIAAAPEMLLVLNAARIMLKNRDQRPEEMKLLDAIKAVIAKAEGH
jgi:hypothetical protein